MATDESTTHALIIADVHILQDLSGRYNLNTLHKASGASETKRPGQWLKRKSTQELITELDSQMSFSTFDVVKGGNVAGVYTHELLAISYAGWISPAFQLKVNQAFLDMKQAHASPMPALHDPAMRALVEMAYQVDNMKHEMAQIAASQYRQDQLLIAQQQTLIDHFVATQQANTKADLALSQQQWITLRQYVFANKLERQLPPSLLTDYGKWLTGYCLEHNIPISRESLADRPYVSENRYHVGTIEATLPSWRTRRNGQVTLLQPS